MNDIQNISGEWIGRYPGHYDQVVRITQNGLEAEAMKITGDDHVPADEITWRANVETGQGEGQIADKGFRNARFVPGRLIIQNQERIEFIWEDCGSVLFRKDD